jgi:2-dehydropantoate 2-reductase
VAEQRIGVVGIGPVGGILSVQLIRAGRHVTAIDIYAEHLDRACSEGLEIEGAEPVSAQVVHACRTLEQAAAEGLAFDLIYVCVKATAVRHVAPALSAVLAKGGCAISFQNGLDTEQGVLAALGAERTLRGVVNYAGNLIGPGRIRQTFFNPPNYLGAAVPGTAPAEARAREVAALMSDCGLATEFSDNIQHHVWEKAIRNAALMPVSALTGQNMAQVMASPESLALVERLLAEEIEIARAVGFAFDQAFYDSTLEYYRRAGTHMPSMRGDVLAGLQTEIEFLNHKIAEYGERHGVACPYNRALANLVLCIDQVAAANRASK